MAGRGRGSGREVAAEGMGKTFKSYPDRKILTCDELPGSTREGSIEDELGDDD